MSQHDINALTSIRTALVTERRAAAGSGDAQAVIRIQRDLGLVDQAIADEQALGQHEKDELAITRAMKQEPDARNVEEISLIDDPIRVSD
ncbi:MAG: hypothetical protein ACTHLT_20460 [Devosia sp.]